MSKPHALLVEYVLRLASSQVNVVIILDAIFSSENEKSSGSSNNLTSHLFTSNIMHPWY